MLENEKQEKRRLETKILDLQDTIENQKKMIEKLRDNRRLDPALMGENNAVARCKSDASFAQARLQESELTLKLRNDQIKSLQKEIEKERQRGDFAEREATRIETDAKKARERNDNVRYKELYIKIRDHLQDSRQAADIARIKHLESKVVELELQLMNPEKDEMAATVRRMELKLDEDHNKMESLKSYIVDVQKQLSEAHSALEASTRESADLERRLRSAELSGRETGRKLAAMEADKQLVASEFEVYKRSVQNSLGDIAQHFEEAEGAAGGRGGGGRVVRGEGGDDEDEFSIEDLQHIDHRELEDFLRNF